MQAEVQDELAVSKTSVLGPRPAPAWSAAPSDDGSSSSPVQAGSASYYSSCLTASSVAAISSAGIFYQIEIKKTLVFEKLIFGPKNPLDIHVPLVAGSLACAKGREWFELKRQGSRCIRLSLTTCTLKIIS